MSVLAWLLPAGLLGWAALSASVGRPRGADLAFALVPCLALGASLQGLVEYGLLATVGTAPPGVGLVIACGLAPLAFRRAPLGERRHAEPRRGLVALGLSLALVVALFAIVSVARHAWYPDGEWDAWDFWVMRARMIVRLGGDWPDAFSPLLETAHPRYPPLWSMSIASAWTLSGDEATRTPWLLCVLHGVGAVALVGWAVARLRGLGAGLLAAATLAAVPRFVVHASSQYADIPLGFHFLGMVVALALYERERARGWLVLAGLFAGLAVLMKNEGALFALALALGLAVAKRPRIDRSNGGALVLGAAFPVLAYLHFRSFVAPRFGGTSEDFAPKWDEGLAGVVEHALTRAAVPGNWWDLLEGLRATPRAIDEGIVPLFVALPVLLVLAGWSSRAAPRTLRAAWVACALYVIAISLSFVLISLWTVEDHVGELSRLALQVVPVALFATFAGAWPDPAAPST